MTNTRDASAEVCRPPPGQAETVDVFDAATSRILDMAPDGVIVADLSDPDQRVVYVNDVFETMTGYSREEALGRNCRYLQGGDRNQPGVEEMRAAIRKREPICVTLRNYRKDGSSFWNELHLAPLRDGRGRGTHYVGMMRDVTAQREAIEDLAWAANVDRMTGCLNAYALMDRLTELCATSQRCVMVIKIDVVGFNDINSGYGYEVGDALQKEIANRLMSMEADAVGLICANEFAIGFRIEEGADGMAQLASVQAALRPQFILPGAVINARFHIGYVVGAPGADGQTLVRHAGTALFQSKRSHPHLPCAFDSEVSLKAHNKLRLTSELQQALANRDFLYHYQPKIDIATGAVTGAEALIRWNHGLFGLQMPSGFIPLAEETGMMPSIGLTTFPTFAAFVARMNEGRDVPLNFSINISTNSFLRGDLPKTLAGMFADAGVDPRWVTLELTEDVMAESSPALLATFGALRALGLGLSIDDFGTGYSSLRYLETFPVTEIKIDRSFVSGLTGHPPKRIIVDSVIRLGEALAVNVIAEGIETAGEYAELRELGCPGGQGYLFGKPMPATDFMKLVA